MKKILVTGGSGFIGSNLIKKLLSYSYKVNCLDIYENKSLQHKNFKFYKGDIFEDKILNKAINNCDIVIHLAASLGVKNTDTNQIECLDVNIYGTKKILNAARKNKIKLFLYSSSSEIYGDQKKFPIKENSKPQNKSVYATSKIVAENYVRAFYQKYKLNYNIVRFFNVYGPDQKKNFVIPKYIDLASKNKNLLVYGNGNQIRSFCHVDDAVEGLLEIIKNGKKNTSYNIGNDNQPISIYNLAKTISSIFKKKINVKKIPYSKSDRKADREIEKRIPSLVKIKKDTNYLPNISLTEGLIGMVKKKDLLTNKYLANKLGIGTLQFGQKYGIANKEGKVKTSEVKKIKTLAKNNFINIIDTANVYGDSEKRLGKLNFSKFKLVSKLPVSVPPKNRFSWVLASIRKSLKNLKVDRIYCMHVHNTKYLLDKNGHQIYNGLKIAKEKGIIKKIGVSIYTVQELKKIISKYEIDLVLIPFNIFDQRTLKSNILKELKSKNIEIHTRTTFLQGLLLLKKNEVPSKFYKYQKYFNNFDRLQKKLKLSKFEICLRYALSNEYIDKVVVGMDNSKQFKMLIKSAGYLKTKISSVDASKEINLINPAKW